MENQQKNISNDASNTQRFMDKLKRRFDPMYGNAKLNSLNLGSSENISTISRKPYSTRTRSIQHGAIRAESITEALQGNVT